MMAASTSSSDDEHHNSNGGGHHHSSQNGGDTQKEKNGNLLLHRHHHHHHHHKARKRKRTNKPRRRILLWTVVVSLSALCTISVCIMTLSIDWWRNNSSANNDLVDAAIWIPRGQLIFGGTTKQQQLAIFYHIAASDNNNKQLKDQVKNQLELIAAGAYYSAVSLYYYYTVGEEANDDEIITAICSEYPSLDCIRLRSSSSSSHYGGGGGGGGALEEEEEEVTLHELYGYCQAHASHRVTFVHSSSSSSSRRRRRASWNSNELRIQSTRAVTSHYCTAPPSSQCNLCGLSIKLWPHVRPVGNYFTADCSYVNTLLPPATFVEEMEAIDTSRKNLMENYQRFDMNLHVESDRSAGIGSFALDHWIGSGPDVVPCDVVASIVPTGTNKEQLEKYYNFALQPRYHHPAAPDNDFFVSVVVDDDDLQYNSVLRIKEYSLLAGLTFKWMRLYGRVPPRDSWVWKWYPDGHDWQQAIAMHGESAMDSLLLLLLNRSSTTTTTPAATLGGGDKGGRRRKNIFGTPASSHISIFYNLFAPVKYTDEDVERIADIIKEQMSEVSGSYVASKGKVSFYYNTIGGRAFHTGYMKQLCEANDLDCRHMDHYEKGFEEVTLTKLHDFCQFHPESMVMYIHPKGSFHTAHNETSVTISQQVWRRNMMRAVTSKMCVQLPDTCQICGLLALPFPSLHFSGNFFTAKCDYVRKLLPPHEFMERQAEVQVKALLQRYVYQEFVANLLPDASCHLGVNRFSSEHWLGSHPSVTACDVVKTASIRSMQTRYIRAWDYNFSIYPKHPLKHPWSYIAFLQATLRKPELRRREYYLLPGRIFQWLELYNEIPPSDSWAWNWYPDGKKWKQALEEYGKSAIPILTGEFVDLDKSNLMTSSVEGEAAWDLNMNSTGVDEGWD